jgi:hypothetical protein
LHAALNDKETHRTGSVIAGRYQLRDPLGGGGIGQVYRAWDVQGQRAVAVKLFNPSRCAEDALDRYNKLIAAAGRAGNPGLVLPRGLSLAARNPPMVVMDALTGDDAGKLRARLGRVPWLRALELAGQCAEILHAIYRTTKVAHRDLKPSNLFITERGDVRVLDYGIAEFDIQSADSTRVDTALGTVDYKAPEQLDGRPTDERTDVFALGVVLFELISGSLPFTSGSYYEVARRILMEPAPALAEVAPEAAAPAGVEGLLRRALAKRPDDRFADLQAMADAVAQVRRSPGAVAGAALTASGTMIDPNAQAGGEDEDEDVPTAMLVTSRAQRSALRSLAPASAVPAERTIVGGGGRGGTLPPTAARGGTVPPASRTVVDPNGASGASPQRTVIDPGGASGASPQRTVIGTTTGAGRTVVENADRTVVLRADGGEPPRAGESTMILPDGSDSTVVLRDPSARPQESTMALPDASALRPGETTMALPDASALRPGESTMALPDASQLMRPGGAKNSESTMAIDAPGELPARREAHPGWSLTRTLVVVNVVCGVLILIGLLVKLLVG